MKLFLVEMNKRISAQHFSEKEISFFLAGFANMKSEQEEVVALMNTFAIVMDNCKDPLHPNSLTNALIGMSDMKPNPRGVDRVLGTFHPHTLPLKRCRLFKCYL